MIARCVLVTACVALLALPVVAQNPANTPGKEYSDHLDINAAGAPDPEQNLAWDGLGNVADTFDYFSVGPPPEGDRPDWAYESEVDALAHPGDALFGSVIDNQSALLFSVDGYNQIDVEDIYGGHAVWATAAQINANGVTDVDGLEVWGPENMPGGVGDDAYRYSLEGDPTRTAVWDYTGAPVSQPWLSDAAIAAAIGHPELENEIDLDAMMWGGDVIMFSIDPIGPFDGGEIWVYDTFLGGCNFLWHGGHLWDTAFNVMGTFGLRSENINALESVEFIVPEPSTLVLLGSGLLGLACRKFRKRG